MNAPIYRLPPDLIVGPTWGALEAAPTNWGMRATHIDRLRTRFGEGEVVAILDTGLDQDHPELGGRVKANVSFVPGESAYDGHGHGTHCAGTAVGSTQTIGVSGKAKLLGGKCLSNAGSGSNDWIRNAYKWAIASGATVISMSIGGRGFMEGIEDLVKLADEAGIVTVLAAGNERQQGGLVRFASSALVVAAVDINGRYATFSNPAATNSILSCAAPGVNIVSARSGGGYVTMSGTCIAEDEYVYTPHGPRKIQEVKAGDTVYAQKGGKVVERVVYGVHDRGTAEVHKLTAAGRDVMATASHEMLAFNTKTKEPEWVRLGQLAERHKLLVPRGLTSQVNPYLDTVLSRDFCWLAGFFTGDGWISYTTGGVRTNFASGDKPHVMAEVERIYADVVGKNLKQNKAGSWHYDDCTRMAMVIDAIGLNSPAAGKTVPLWVWSLPEDKQLAFYEGYRTADGHVIKAPERRGVSDAFECVSGDLVRRLACLADYRGWGRGAVRSRTRFGKAPSSKESTWNTSHQLSVYRSPIEGGWQMATRKRSVEEAEAYVRDAGIDTTHYACATQRVLEKYTRTSRVYDLTVPDADCFITHGLVTHNSMATPFVAGVVADYQSERIAAGLPRFRNADFKKLFGSRNVDAGTPGADTDTGPGLLDGELLRLSLVPMP